jgi:hypothetical protein
MRETFQRGPELVRIRRSMPAQTYNLSRILLARAGAGHVFVPIRSMQYLAIVEPHEFNFVHREGRREIEISWQDFSPGERTALDDPVPYDAVFHQAGAAETMRRLQGEFLTALAFAAERSAPSDPGVVLELRKR